MPTHKLSCREGLLHVRVSQVDHSVTVKMLRQLFHRSGAGDMLCAFERVVDGMYGVDVDVQFRSRWEAARAGAELDGRALYEGCCFLAVDLLPPIYTTITTPDDNELAPAYFYDDTPYAAWSAALTAAERGDKVPVPSDEPEVVPEVVSAVLVPEVAAPSDPSPSALTAKEGEKTFTKLCAAVLAAHDCVVMEAVVSPPSPIPDHGDSKLKDTNLGCTEVVVPVYAPPMLLGVISSPFPVISTAAAVNCVAADISSVLLVSMALDTGHGIDNSNLATPAPVTGSMSDSDIDTSDVKAAVFAHEVVVLMFQLSGTTEDDEAEIRARPWPSCMFHPDRPTSRLPWSSLEGDRISLFPWHPGDYLHGNRTQMIIVFSAISRGLILPVTCLFEELWHCSSEIAKIQDLLVPEVDLTPWPSWALFLWVLTVMSKYNSMVSWTAGIIVELFEGNCAIQHCQLLSTGAAVLLTASSSLCFHVSILPYRDDKFSGGKTVVEHTHVFHNCFRFLMNPLAYEIDVVFIHALGDTFSHGTSVHQEEYITCCVVWQWQDPMVTLIHLQPWPSWDLSLIVQLMSCFTAHICVLVNKYTTVNYIHAATTVQAKEAYYATCNRALIATLNADLVQWKISGLFSPALFLEVENSLAAVMLSNGFLPVWALYSFIGFTLHRGYDFYPLVMRKIAVVLGYRCSVTCCQPKNFIQLLFQDSQVAVQSLNGIVPDCAQLYSAEFFQREIAWLINLGNSVRGYISTSLFLVASSIVYLGNNMLCFVGGHKSSAFASTDTAMRLSQCAWLEYLLARIALKTYFLQWNLTTPALPYFSLFHMLAEACLSGSEKVQCKIAWSLYFGCSMHGYNSKNHGSLLYKGISVDLNQLVTCGLPFHMLLLLTWDPGGITIASWTISYLCPIGYDYFLHIHLPCNARVGRYIGFVLQCRCCIFLLRHNDSNADAITRKMTGVLVQRLQMPWDTGVVGLRASLILWGRDCQRPCCWAGYWAFTLGLTHQETTKMTYYLFWEDGYGDDRLGTDRRLRPRLAGVACLLPPPL